MIHHGLIFNEKPKGWQMNPRNVDCFGEERLSRIKTRISQKIEDYEKYSFTQLQDCALKTFFDLAQEFEDQRDFYTICVMIPKVFFSIECVLYLVNQDGNLETACHSRDLYGEPVKIGRDMPDLIEEQVISNNSILIPIKGKTSLFSHKSHVPGANVLGIFEIHLVSGLTEHTKLFFEKYVNRIGFQLHNRLIIEKNQEHLRFIKNLVNDIGHNVIVPNMYFKLFFRRMKGKLDRTGAVSKEIRNKLGALKESLDNGLVQEVIPLAEELEYVNESMEEQFQQILSHYEQTSLFLETLLRQSHFEKGRYVIEPKLVNFREKVIRPQLNRYLSRLQERNIAVDNQLSGIPDEEITVVVDVGLISQAYANFFSNAAKYTREVHDEDGHLQKFIAVGMEFLEGYFGKGKDGVKFNVFSTGPPIPPEDVPGLFDEGYRGKNVESEYGTGHGLQFIKEVIELHGGTAGYEPTKMGNNFYFILPK